MVHGVRRLVVQRLAQALVVVEGEVLGGVFLRSIVSRIFRTFCSAVSPVLVYATQVSAASRSRSKSILR